MFPKANQIGKGYDLCLHAKEPCKLIQQAVFEWTKNLLNIIQEIDNNYDSLISNRDAICGLLGKCYKNHETW